MDQLFVTLNNGRRCEDSLNATLLVLYLRGVILINERPETAKLNGLKRKKNVMD